jgi:hypothetical protein
MKAIEMMVLIVILSNWWNPALFPAASKKYISERCGISIRQVQRTITSLERKGLIKRMASFDSGGANRFELTGLLRLIRQIAFIQVQRGIREPMQFELNFDGTGDFRIMKEKLFKPEEDDEIPI